VSRLRDLQLARKAKAHGAHYSLRIVYEARRAGLPISLAFALVEHESGFQNQFGHDRGAWRPADGKVTKSTVAELLRRVRLGGVSNGVGLTQLTYPPFIHRANQLGGAWLPKYQLRVGFEQLASLVKHYGVARGLAAYNAGDPDNPTGRRYALAVLEKQRRWHQRLTR
jgi:hypothetical protein